MKKQGKILIVDDELGVRESLKFILKEKYDIFAFDSGKEAISSFSPGLYDVALLDIKMPEMTGIELLKRLKNIDPEIIVIMITGHGTLETAQAAINLGASGYISKPFDRHDLERMIEENIQKKKKREEDRLKLVELEKAKKQLDDEIRKVYSSTLESLIIAVNVKDSYTSSHSQEVATLTTRILEASGKIKNNGEEKVILHYVASLHDIGKIGIKEDILKKPGSLNLKEWEEIKKHPVIGAEILAPIEFLRDYICIVRNHHERFDGKGYPDGLKAEEIPFYARVISIADAFHAMCSDRPYRKSLGKERALEILQEEKGKQFEPELVDIATKVLENMESDLYI
ncbi:response regulator [Candidatus Calescamantes bacterium]|nr:response regulator [Candidatus Calescamantes bacterium]